jgi:hypothetical protein
MQQRDCLSAARGSARVAAMAALVVILACAYVALDIYTGGQQNASMVEGRAGAILSALSRYKRETGTLPDSLEMLVPQYIPALASCPNGQPYAYSPRGREYTLGCADVLFGSKPYQYDSAARAWRG